MTDERWKSLLSFVQFILGTVVLGVFSAIISNQIQTREVEIKEQELISKNIGTVLSPNTGDKFLMAQFYAAVTRSSEIRERWVIYRDELKKEIDDAKKEIEKAEIKSEQTKDAKVVDQQQAIIQQISATITPSIKQPQIDSLPARVYFHIQNEGQREKLASIAKAITLDTDVIVPGIQKVDNAPKVNELRYFKSADAANVEALVETFKANGINVVSKYFPGYESSQRLRPRHYELWLSAGWN